MKEKRAFFEDNEERLALSQAQNKRYIQQSVRKHCKICGSELAQYADLQQHGSLYTFCKGCGHLNGAYEDTAEFSEFLYTADGGEEYAEDYVDPDFRARVVNVYEPKIEFLRGALHREDLSILDVGCGAGHLVYAAILSGVPAYGIDVSRASVEYGNREINTLNEGNPVLAKVGEEEFYSRIVCSGASVISAIGVIEHLREPGKLFEAFHKSPARYLFFSVPMFSLSVLLENAFPNVYPRQLSGAHTHLFTEDSLAFLYRSERLEPIAEWRFGTDAMDLYRSLWVALRHSSATTATVVRLEEEFQPLVDRLQAVLDQAHFCSEIHVVARKV